MFLQRSAIAVARRAAPRVLAQRTFTTSFVHRDASSEAKEAKENNIAQKELDTQPTLPVFSRIQEARWYVAPAAARSRARPTCFPGCEAGTVSHDAEQATGLERLEILEDAGIDIFDMRPLDASRLGTMEDPITVNAAGDEQYVGCTGFPADSHNVLWITLTRDEPKSRCMECGSVYEMHYVGPKRMLTVTATQTTTPTCEPIPQPKNMADFLKPNTRSYKIGRHHMTLIDSSFE
ncbi:Cytochrome c oxidase polypeptide IV mitochondrial [Pyrenophora tritici-repentis]|nr:Cytochrome c oxidase polypeptide IV mitochondrial [Pyrenophora tritici-repentis]